MMLKIRSKSVRKTNLDLSSLLVYYSREIKIFQNVFCTATLDPWDYTGLKKADSQPAFACSKLTTETLEQGVKYVQS